MSYKETLSSGIVITGMQTEHAEQLEALQRIVFPNLIEEELLHADQYKKHVELFPEGQHGRKSQDVGSRCLTFGIIAATILTMTFCLWGTLVLDDTTHTWPNH